MTGLQKTAAALLAVILTVAPGSYSVAAQSSPSYGPDAKACKLMPTPELEASLRRQGQRSPWQRRRFFNLHGEHRRTCGQATERAAGNCRSAGLDSAGTRGSAHDAGRSEASSRTNTKDFGKVGCLSHEDEEGIRRQFAGQALAHYVVLSWWRAVTLTCRWPVKIPSRLDSTWLRSCWRRRRRGDKADRSAALLGTVSLGRSWRPSL